MAHCLSWFIASKTSVSDARLFDPVIYGLSFANICEAANQTSTGASIPIVILTARLRLYDEMWYPNELLAIAWKENQRLKGNIRSIFSRLSFDVTTNFPASCARWNDYSFHISVALLPTRELIMRPESKRQSTSRLNAQMTFLPACNRSPASALRPPI